jgi:hypothetical protein
MGVQTLQVVAVTSDGSAILVADEAGRQLRLPVDDRLRAAVRGDLLPSGQLQISLDSQLSPRDIQARVRAGASVDEVAEEAGVGAERVLRYAAPVLDERRHVAQKALGALVRTDGSAEMSALGDVVDASLRGRAAGGSLRWDSWRRDDGRWVVACRWIEDDQERGARWLLDPAGRSVAPQDDEARAVAGLPPEGRPGPTRLAVVRDDQPSAAAAAAGPGAVPEDDTPTGPLPDLTAATDSAVATPPAAAGAARPGRPPRNRTAAREDDRLWLPDLDESVPPPARAAGESSSRRQRPPVPSWDEIMFGRRS